MKDRIKEMADGQMSISQRVEEGFQTLVFDLEQRPKGDLLRAFCVSELPDDSQEAYDLIRHTIESGGIRVIERQLPSAPGESLGGLINIQQGLDSQMRTRVLVHEWAHELMHQPYDEEEWDPFTSRLWHCQATATTYIVLRYLGIDDLSFAGSLHVHDMAPSELASYRKQIQETAQSMIEKLEKK